MNKIDCLTYRTKIILNCRFYWGMISFLSYMDFQFILENLSKNQINAIPSKNSRNLIFINFIESIKFLIHKGTENTSNYRGTSSISLNHQPNINFQNF